MKDTIKPPHIVLTKGKHRWYWMLVAHNGEIISVSQKYVTKFNARRQANREAVRQGLIVREA